MRAKNVTISELQQALAVVNKRYGGNVEFRRLEQNGRGVRFTLKVRDSKGPGHRLGFPKFMGFDAPPDFSKRRRLPYACWHVHGDFFDALLHIQSAAVIVTSGSLANPLREDSITKNGGNWQDWQIGSRVAPYAMSEACDCCPGTTTR